MEALPTKMPSEEIHMHGLMSELRKSIPRPVKVFLKRLYLTYLGALDLFFAAARRRDMLPPRSLYSVGDGDFKAIGLEFRTIFVKYGGVKPDDRVLDVGCGIGRMAVPLTDYLSVNGKYYGFDIVKSGIDWCKDTIAVRFPNFQFYHSDIQNMEYNPQGTIYASDYRFPFESSSFDFVFLTSVFTHLFPPDMENYLKEISRVLKEGGVCLITFFLVNKESEALIIKGISTQNFVYEIGGCYTTGLENPEQAIAFTELDIRNLYGKYGLSVQEPIRYGSWCGRERFLSYQDIVIAKKE